MDAGDTLRKRWRRNDAMAMIAVVQIGLARCEITGDAERPSACTAYILRSLKRPEEIVLLRTVYGRRFFPGDTRDVTLMQNSNTTMRREIGRQIERELRNRRLVKRARIPPRSSRWSRRAGFARSSSTCGPFTQRWRRSPMQPGEALSSTDARSTARHFRVITALATSLRPA